LATAEDGVPLVGYARYLNDLLRRLRVEHGSPPLREIATRIPGSASPGYLSEIFAGKKVPSPEMAGLIAAALGADEVQQQAARSYADAATADDRPGPASVVRWRVESFPLTAPPLPEGTAPSALLNARYQVVGFTRRDEELRKSAAWRDEPGSVLRVRLLHGQGGQGKTRLAAEFAARSARAGWAVGQLRHLSDTARPAKPLPAGRLRAAAGLLLVLDYAERWPVQDLIDCLISYQAGIRGDKQTVPVRVLLLARPSGGWWQGVRAALHEHDLAAARNADDLTAAVTADQLAPLVPEPADREVLFDAARDRFAALLQLTDITQVKRPPRLATDPEFGRALTVHMAALAAVDAATTGTTPPAEAADLSGYLLDRERQHWQKLHAKSRTPDGGGTDETAITTSPTDMAHIVYTAILTRPQPYPAGTAILVQAGIASQSDAGRMLTDHAVCYPPTDPSTVLEPLYPDRLAEDFLALTSSGIPNGAADPWATTALTTLLTSDLDTGPPSYSGQAITVLIEAARRWPHLAHRHLFPLLRTHPRLALTAGGAALTTLADTPDIDLAVLEALEPLLPTGRHLDLDIAAAAITSALTPHRLADTTDPAEHGRLHSVHALRLANAGRRDEALAAAEEAVVIRRRLAEANPAAYLPDLAMSLNNLGTFLSGVGRREQALASAEEAVVIRRRLAEANPAAHLPNLAMSLWAYGWVCVKVTANLPQALESVTEAIALYVPLAQRLPQMFAGRLFSAYQTLANVLDGLGRTQEAADLRRQLAHPSREEPDAD
jgi:Tetratricopeptide repeat